MLTFRTIEEIQESLRKLQEFTGAEYLWVNLHKDGSGRIEGSGAGPFKPRPIVTFRTIQDLEINLPTSKVTVNGGDWDGASF